ncbi:MAG: hypothetical protein AAGG38_06240 [Planctomycetota bacterium]
MSLTEPACAITTVLRRLDADDWRLVALAISDIMDDRWGVGPWPQAFIVAKKIGCDGQAAIAGPSVLNRDDVICVNAAVKVRFCNIGDPDEWPALHRIMDELCVGLL